MEKNIKIITLTMLLAAGSVHITEAMIEHITTTSKVEPKNETNAPKAKSPAEIAKAARETASLKAKEAKAREVAEAKAREATEVNKGREVSKNEPNKENSLDFNESRNEIKFDSLKELNDYLAKESTRPEATLLEFNTSRIKNSDGTTKIREEYSNGTVKITNTEPYSQGPAKIFIIHKDGTRIVTEYANGKITSSTITRPDATEIKTEYHNGKMKDGVTLTKPDGTKIETEYNSKGEVSYSKITPPEAPAPEEITLEPTLDDSAKVTTIEHSDGTQEITYSPITTAPEPIAMDPKLVVTSIFKNPNNEGRISRRDDMILDRRNTNLKLTINSDGSRTLTDPSYGSGEKAASITIDSNNNIIRSNDPFAKEFLRIKSMPIENAPIEIIKPIEIITPSAPIAKPVEVVRNPSSLGKRTYSRTTNTETSPFAKKAKTSTELTLTTEQSAPVEKPVETATQARPSLSRTAPQDKATLTKNQAVIKNEVENTAETIANQKTISEKTTSNYFSRLFSKLGIRKSKPEIDALAKETVKTAPKPDSSPGVKAHWLESFKQSLFNMVSSSKTTNANAPKVPVQ